MSQDVIYEHIGREIAQQRQVVGLSQADLARLVGLTRSSISNIEKGRQKMLVHTLLDVAGHLKISPSALLPATSSRNSEQQSFTGSEVSSEERKHIESILGLRQ